MDDLKFHAMIIAPSAKVGGTTFKMTGHASDALLARYIRDGESFVNNAAGAQL